jgi:hypothetical protein
VSELTTEHRRPGRGLGLFQRLRDARLLHMQGTVIGEDADSCLVAWDNDAGSGPLTFERMSRASHNAYCPHPAVRWAGPCADHAGRRSVADALDAVDATEAARQRMAARLAHGLTCYGVELRVGWRPAKWEVVQELTDALIGALRWRLWQVSPGVGALVLDLIDVLDLALARASPVSDYAAFAPVFELDAADYAWVHDEGGGPATEYVGVYVGDRALAVHEDVLDGSDFGHQPPLVFELDDRPRVRTSIENLARYRVHPRSLLRIALDCGLPRYSVNGAVLARLRLGVLRYGRTASLLDEREASPAELRRACDDFLIEITDAANYAVAYDDMDMRLVIECLRLLDQACAEPALRHTDREPAGESGRLCAGWSDIEVWRRRRR